MVANQMGACLMLLPNYYRLMLRAYIEIYVACHGHEWIMILYGPIMAAILGHRFADNLQ